MSKLYVLSAKIQSKLSNPIPFFITAFGIAFALSLARALMPFTSPWDEHTHLSYLQYVYNWQIPAEGFPMNSWAKDAFSCYGHALYGKLTDVPCGVHAEGSEYPTGGTNTSQVWPPVYFIIVAIIMRVPILLGLDPLMSARTITVLLWSLGVAWLGLISWRKSRTITLSLGVVALLVALPSFFFYTSFVSPHSLNPLIVAAFIFTGDRLIQKASELFNKTPHFFAREAFLAGIKNQWGYVLIGLSFLVAFAVPQAMTIVGFLVVYITITLLLKTWHKSRKWSLSYLAAVGLFGMFSTIVFYSVHKFWLWQKDFRAIPVTSDVDPSRANIDIPNIEYSSPFEQMAAVWWNFWPNGLIPEAPAGPDGTAVITPWFIVISALSVAAILFWKKRDWLGPAMLSLFITAPIFSIIYDIIFPTGVPLRYGLIFPIIGVLSVANRYISLWPNRVLIVLISITYLSAFVMNYMFVYRSCGLDEVTRLITCG